MPQYVDGFVLPIPRARLDDYKQVANSVAEIYREHGAIEYLEFVGDDMNREGTRPFPDLVNSSPNETVVFGWIVYESREARDLVNELVEADPRMTNLVGPLVDSSDPVFVPTRMAYGGFVPFVENRKKR